MFRSRRLNEQEMDRVSLIANRCYKNCYQIALRYTKAPESAEDVVQQSFEALMRAMPTLDSAPDEDLERYVIRVTYNISKKFLKGSEKETCADDLTDIPDTSLNVEEQLYQHYEQELIAEIVQELPAQTKEYLIQKYIYEYSNQQIAENIGFPLNQISMIQSRALQIARKHINLKEGRKRDAKERTF